MYDSMRNIRSCPRYESRDNKEYVTCYALCVKFQYQEVTFFIYEICYINTPTSAVQFGRVMQHWQRAGATAAMRVARGVGEGCEVIGLVKPAEGKTGCQTCGNE